MVAVLQTTTIAVGMVTQATPQPSPTQPPRYIDPSVVSPGLIGFVLFVGLGIAVVLLWLSMNRHLKKVNFDDGSGAGNGAEESDPGAGRDTD
jgi:hypothetical protein